MKLTQVLPFKTYTHSHVYIYIYTHNFYITHGTHIHGNTVSSVTGSDVALPCEVDILKCGKISQILWSKNFSTVWKPILSQTYHHQSESSSSSSNQMTSSRKSSLNTLDSVLSNMSKHKIDERFTLDIKSNTSHALLRVSSVTIQDEGLYKCDITYVQPTCPSITYVKLHTMGKLSSSLPCHSRQFHSRDLLVLLF